MTRRDSFSAEEWALLGDAPLAAAAAVAVASPGGGRREAEAMMSGWREAGRRFGASELMTEVVAALDPERREGGGQGAGYTYNSIVDEALDLCARAVVMLRDRAAPDEFEEYRAFVIHIAEQVAWANSESGFLGIGGEAMSRDERQIMGAIARALGYGR
ncbi:MAG: hypothetical protein HGA45_04045 [Chloroflexales bacterium]|nr:hypothetical protein [Chloroflexales bacterium]